MDSFRRITQTILKRINLSLNEFFTSKKIAMIRLFVALQAQKLNYYENKCFYDCFMDPGGSCTIYFSSQLWELKMEETLHSRLSTNYIRQKSELHQVYSENGKKSVSFYVVTWIEMSGKNMQHPLKPAHLFL